MNFTHFGLAPSELDDFDDVPSRTSSRLSTTGNRGDLGSMPGQKVNHLPKISPRDKKNGEHEDIFVVVNSSYQICQCVLYAIPVSENERIKVHQ